MGYTRFGKFELSGNPQSILVAIPPTGPILECSWILRKHQSPLRSYLLSYFRTAAKEMQFFPCSKSFQIEIFFPYTCEQKSSKNETELLLYTHPRKPKLPPWPCTEHTFFLMLIKFDKNYLFKTPSNFKQNFIFYSKYLYFNSIGWDNTIKMHRQHVKEHFDL